MTNTKCIIRLITTDEKGDVDTDLSHVWLCHKFDGDPENVGRELVRFAETCVPTYDAGQFATELIQSNEPMYTYGVYNFFQITCGQLANMDYLYEVYVGKTKGRKVLPPTVRAFPLHNDEKIVGGGGNFKEIDLSTIRGEWEDEYDEQLKVKKEDKKCKCKAKKNRA